MIAAARKANVTSDDRLALTIVVAILVHAMIVLGVSFAPEKGTPSRFESMEVILVPERSPQAPDKADVLAQANLVGGGSADDKVRPTAPLKSALPATAADIAAVPPPPTPEITTPATPQPPATPAPRGRAPVKDKVAKLAARADLAAPRQQDNAAAAAPAEQPAPAQPAPQQAVNSEPVPTAAQLLTRAFSSALIDAEIQERLDVRAKRPRHQYISASTKEYKYAAYMEAWRAKVERIGNINYPDEARQRRLSGDLRLDVALNPDGSVLKIDVRESSGKQVLDDAAVRIVELAAPYAAFPPDIRNEVDVLHITRTWKFKDESGFSTGN